MKKTYLITKPPFFNSLMNCKCKLFVLYCQHIYLTKDKEGELYEQRH